MAILVPSYLNETGTKSCGDLICDLTIILLAIVEIMHLISVFFNIAGAIEGRIIIFIFGFVAALSFYLSRLILYKARYIDVIASFIAVACVLLINRPDADDGYYLLFNTLFLDKIDQPVATILSPTWGTKGYPLSFFTFAAGLMSSISGIKLLIWYYYIIPSWMAVVAVLFFLRTCDVMGVERRLLAIAWFFLVSLTYADTHRTIANFGFCRFFQSKCYIVWITVPAVFYYFSLWMAGKKINVIMLLLALIAGCGFSPTGIPIMITYFVILIIPSVIDWLSGKKINILRYLVVSSVVFILMYLVAHKYWFFCYGKTSLGFEIVNNHECRKDSGFHGWGTNMALLENTYGFGVRGVALLLSIPASTLFFYREKRYRMMACYCCNCLLLLSFPYTPELMSTVFYPTFGWRWIWVLPVIQTSSKVIDSIFGFMGGGYLSSCLMLAAFFSFSVIAPKPIVSPENGSALGIGYKINVDNNGCIGYSHDGKSCIRLRNGYILSRAGRLY